MSVFGNLGNWLFGGNQNNPANAAEPYLNQGGQYLNQIPGYYQNMLSQFQNTFNPYISAGAGELPNLQQQYNNMLDPNFINQVGKNFQQSPGYQWQMNQALQGANQAAAAGGYAGTPAHQQQAETVASGLANQDYYNWLNHSLGARQQALQGEQGIAGLGLNAGGLLGQGLQGYARGLGNYAEDQAENAMSQANLAYAGKQNANETNLGGLGALFGGLGSFFGGGGGTDLMKAAKWIGGFL